MSRPGLHLGAVHDAWHGGVRRARLTAPGGAERPVLVVLGAEGADEAAAERARASAAPVIALRCVGVLPLIAVVLVRDRVGWVYEHADVVSAAQAAAPALSLRAAAELVAGAAAAVAETGLTHPGPDLDDVLIDASGAVRVAGFVGPFPQDPSMRPPGPATGDAAQAWRLGVLLAVLASGARPARAADPASHQAAVRRVVIGALSRGGPSLTDRYGNWMKGLLAYDPKERPALSSIADGLRAAAIDVGGPSLAEWAALSVPARLADAAPPPPVSGDGWKAPTPAPGPSRGASEAPTRRERAPSSQRLSARDEPTGGSVPVNVGPPPEAVPRRPRLPRGFLDPAGPTAPTPGPPRRAARIALAVVTVALLLAAAGLIAYLVAPSVP